ncbi:C39 family peptidase [Methanolobus profundi]|uniref:Peptidase_C39 like family protein n=1 Tax=Methanolobus profundi TaxID=487685 RepID=A0A1I4PE05_9EURY|nr:C39 family peptidase [Methanolobus profundi]SFM25825.1 Peptidase_C39 like family protein [Methanolobus profundi]
MGAQSDTKYEVTIKEAYRHANVYMVNSMTKNMPGLETWNESSINPCPLELYDINGDLLYYEFSVEKEDKVIGRIKVGANKLLGYSVKTFEFGMRSWDPKMVMQKSVEVANNKYSDGEILSTKMVVYSYPSIGSMTIIRDKKTGEEKRIFVDAYTLEIIPDKTADDGEIGVWSFYEKISDKKANENLAKWTESEDFVSSVEKSTEDVGLDIYTPLTNEMLSQLREKSAIITSTKGNLILNVPLYAQSKSYYCAPASAQMIAKFYGVTHTQNYIYGLMNDGSGGACTNTEQLNYYQASNGLNKPNSYLDNTPTYSEAKTKISQSNPLKSGVTDHARVCRGYYDSYGVSGQNALYINDPANGGSTYWEEWDDIVHTNYIYVL